MKCLECKEDLVQTVGKREKQFCNSTCRSNYWQKSKRKISENNKPENKKRIKEERKSITEIVAINPLTPDECTEKHPLYQDGDPKENSMAFFNKYNCMTYDELQKTINDAK